MTNFSYGDDASYPYITKIILKKNKFPKNTIGRKHLK